MHPQARGYVARTVIGTHYPAVVEVGGRWINGGIRDLISCESFTALDLHPGEDVDVVADVCDWTPPAPVDLVICCEVLEHASQARRVVECCIAMLNPGGRFVMTCAGPDRPPHSGLDGAEVRDGEHYANVTPDEMSAWMSGLKDVEVTYHQGRGDLYATGVAP